MMLVLGLLFVVFLCFNLKIKVLIWFICVYVHTLAFYFLSCKHWILIRIYDAISMNVLEIFCVSHSVSAQAHGELGLAQGQNISWGIKFYRIIMGITSIINKIVQQVRKKGKCTKAKTWKKRQFSIDKKKSHACWRIRGDGAVFRFISYL